MRLFWILLVSLSFCFTSPGLSRSHPRIPQHVEQEEASAPMRSLSKAIACEVQDQTGSQEAHLRFDSKSISQLASYDLDDLRVEEVTIDSNRHHFVAKVSVLGERKPLILKGGFTLSMKAPLVIRSIAPGQRIREQDLSWETTQIRSNVQKTILNTQDLLGKTPAKRSLEPGHVIQAKDVQKLILVHKNDAVKLQFVQAGLCITQQCKALDEGGQGDLVRVLNPISRKTLVGTVTARKEVTIRGGSQPERPIS